MADTAPPFWQIKLSSKGQLTVPAEVIAQLGLTKGSDYLYLFLDDQLIEIVTFRDFPKILKRRGGPEKSLAPNP